MSLAANMLRVFQVSGQELVTMRTEELDDVLALKRHLRTVYGFPVSIQQLLHHGSHLIDSSDLTQLEMPMDVQVVLSGLSSVEQKREASTELLEYAATQGHLQVARFLLEAGADKDVRDVRDVHDGHYGDTPLISASVNGHAEVVGFLLEAGAAKNVQGFGGATALSAASRKGHVRVAGLLLESGADPNIQDQVGSTALHHASDAGHAEIVRLLVDADADKDAHDKNAGNAALIFTSSYSGELAPWHKIGEEPKCARRCFSGTAVANGQVLQRLLPPAVPFAVWILTDDHDASGIAGGHCANYDFELELGPIEPSRLTSEFLGPPAWLCEGGAWPARLEQLPYGAAGTADSGRPSVLRQHSFALRDVFDLTRPSQSGISGVHSLEIQVSEPSDFRLTTHFPTVPARPQLAKGRQEEAWLSLGRSTDGEAFSTVRVPAAGREFRHSISAELQPGEYTVLFIMEMPAGGLRPCASVLLNLALEPKTEESGSCPSYDRNGILDLQAMSEPLPLSAWTERPKSFQVMLPRPEGGGEDGEGDAKGLQIIARSSMNIGEIGAGGLVDTPPVLLHAKVLSPFLHGDLQITFYEDGQPIAEPRPLPDGNGYAAMVGPVRANAFYEVVLLHAPRKPTTRSTCVDVSVDLASVSLTPPSLQGRFVAPLPGADTCWLSGQFLPSQIRVREGVATVVEGEYLLPPAGGSHAIQITGVASDVILKATVSSADAEVRIGQEPLTLDGLGEDRFFGTGALRTVSVRAARLASASTSCPLLKLHLVLTTEKSLLSCPSAGATPLQELAKSLAEALTEQPADMATLRQLSATLPGQDFSAASAPVTVLAASAELRLELSLEAPWLPLELLLLRQGQEEKAWARARPSGRRLVMLLPNLPKGQYQLMLKTWMPSTSLPSRCVELLGTAALLAPGGRDTSNYRQEMLDLPEILAVAAPPAKLTPGWWQVMDRMLFSEIFAIPAGGAATSAVSLDAPAVLRIVAEPADILAPRMSIEVHRGLMEVMPSSSAVGPGVVFQLQPGSYELRFRSTDIEVCRGCPHDAVPFFVTIGLGAADDAAGSSVHCDSVTRMMDLGSDLKAENAFESTNHLNIRALPSSMKLPVKVGQPSVVTIAAWSPFIAHYVRVALVTEEGLWVGEQRCRRSSLEIELPPGDYQMIVEEPAPLAPSPQGCMAMGVAVSLAPFTSVARSLRPGQVAMHSAAATLPAFLGPGLGLGARCDGLGALPLPLDVISTTGGSLGLGGPIDGSGRLLIRQRVMLTDIHDGRKKVFLRVPAWSLVRVAVASADAESVEVVLEDSGHQPIIPADTHILGAAGGRAASYSLEGGGSLWLSFHREHRIAAGAGCASFDWMLQVMPSGDTTAMSDCGPESSSLEDLAAKAVSSFGTSAVAAADGRVQTGQPGGTSASLPLSLAESALVEVEVQFNFLLSNIHLWLEVSAGASGGPVEAAGPAIAAHGVASAARNAQAVLQLRLAAGQHAVRIRHDDAIGNKAFARTRRCVPLGLRLRRVSLLSPKPVVGPFLAAPLASGADLVLSITTPTGDGEPALPSLVGLPPTATSAAKGAAVGGLVAAWSGSTLSTAALAGEGRAVEPAPGTGSRLWALPLHFEGQGEAGEVWIALDRSGTGTPWSGQTPPALTGPPRLWPPSVEPARSALRREVAGLIPLSEELEKESAHRHQQASESVLSTRLIFWLVVLAALAYYLYTSRPAWFVNLTQELGGLVERQHQKFTSGREFAVSEMGSMVEFTSAFTRRREEAQPRSAARMYGTLDL
ncbi:unnamed protein product [Symbiodinium natans]|uniref:Ubiquitin-like domain-containing protein n=1 Tax=Symbiodinium natans TaxID=878477 RepID=A0A812QNC4_9DINO|nr:unnamed protein product [Symbiodinium natans]